MPETTTLSTPEKVELLARRIGTECKTLHDKIGDLSTLSTTAKTSIVAALNEQVKALDTLKDTVGGNTTAIEAAQAEIASLKAAVESASNIDDTKAGTITTYSSSKIESEITAAKQAVKDDLLGGAGAAYDTLKELADLITTNQDAITALQTIAAGHVKFDAAQELTDDQKAQARTNIGAASSADVSALQTTVGTKASQSDLNTVSAKVTELEEKVGDVEACDPVTAFEEALSGTGA